MRSAGWLAAVPGLAAHRREAGSSSGRQGWHRTPGVIFSSLALFPLGSDPRPPSASTPLGSPTCDHAPDSDISALFKEKSQWEGKQNALESELRDLHETVASLQSRLRQAELQKMEAQVKGRSGEECLRSCV